MSPLLDWEYGCDSVAATTKLLCCKDLQRYLEAAASQLKSSTGIRTYISGTLVG